MAAPTVSYTGQYKMTESGKNWELRLLTSGTLTLSKNTAVDLFLVGGGGGGSNGYSWYYGGGGGGGGYTRTVNKLRLSRGTAYSVTVGAGGASKSAGGATSAFGYSASGGKGGGGGNGGVQLGGAGGSGGGNGAYIGTDAGYGSSGEGGSNGSNGGLIYGGGGTGQKTTTRAFGESGGELFSGGGGGGSAVSSNWINGYYGTRNSGSNAPGGSGGGAGGGGRNSAGQAAAANTGGGGGGGGSNTASGGAGGSGIVILRNTRYGATTLVSAKNGVFGSPIQITLSRDDASATHTLKAVLLNSAGSEIYTETIASQTATYPTVNWTPSVALYAPLIKNAASARFQIKCYTYVDGDEQGEEELDAPITVSFRAEDVSPEIGEGCVTLSPYNTGVVEGISCFVQGYSKADSSFDDSKITLKYGASVAKREIIMYGESNSVAPYRTGILPGVVELTAKVTDSRGFSGQRKIMLTPNTYSKPRLSEISIFRCDDTGAADETGGRISVKATGTVSSLKGENTMSMTAAFKAKYGSYGAEQSISSGVSSVLTGSASPDEIIVVRLTVTDRLGGTTEYEQTLTHRKWAMKFRENGEGVAFGKAPAANKVLEIPEDWEIMRGQQVLSWGGAIDAGSVLNGGAKFILLWEDFNSLDSGQQTITLDDEGQQLLVIVTVDVEGENFLDSFIVPIIEGTFVKMESVAHFDGQLIRNFRLVQVESRTSLIFTQDFVVNEYGDVLNEGAGFNLPFQIYGIKF